MSGYRNHTVIKARTRPRVARGTCLLHSQQDRVGITVIVHRNDFLNVTRCVTLAPIFLSRTRPIRRTAARSAPAHRLGIHPAEHQNLQRLNILHNSRDQAVRIEFQNGSIEGRRCRRFARIGGGICGKLSRKFTRIRHPPMLRGAQRPTSQHEAPQERATLRACLALSNFPAKRSLMRSSP